MFEKFKDFQITVVAVILALGLIVAAKCGTENIARDGISVTGVANQDVVSDTANVRIEINANEPTKVASYNKIKTQLPVVKKFLTDRGFVEADIDVLSVNSYPTYITNQKTGYQTENVAYYNYSLPVKVTSKDVNKIKSLASEAQNLLDSGVDVTVQAPEYSYSDLANLKVQLLEKATTDARNRAKAMLKANHNKVGKIQSVKMGVFQVTTPDSTDVSDSGINDTSSINKKVTAVANVVFKIK